MAGSKKVRSPRDLQKSTRIYLWRHPEVQGYQEGKFWGQTDVALTRRGKIQMKNVAEYMSAKKIQALYCSPLRRTAEVAEAVGRALKPRIRAEKIPELKELALGKWEGLTYQQIDKKYPGALQSRAEDLVGYQIEDGESLEKLSERVVPAFRKLVDQNFGKQICIVAHAGVNRVILTRCLGAPLANLFRMEQEYACLNIIEVFEDGLPLIKGLNMGVA